MRLGKESREKDKEMQFKKGYIDDEVGMSYAFRVKKEPVSGQGTLHSTAPVQYRSQLCINKPSIDPALCC